MSTLTILHMPYDHSDHQHTIFTLEQCDALYQCKVNKMFGTDAQAQAAYEFYLETLREG